MVGVGTGDMSTGKFIFKATLTIAFFSLLSRFLGLVRDIVIARQFGASVHTDAYLVAFTAPNLLFAVISGALVAVVVPVFTEYATKKEKQEAWKVFNTVFNVVTVIFIIVSAAGMIGSVYVVKLIAPGFQGEAARLAEDLTRIMFPLLLFSGWASLFTGLLNANNIFGVPAFSGVANNMVIILSALTLGSFYGIHGLAAGTVIAMALMGLIQLPVLVRAGYRYKPVFDIGHPGVKKVFYLAMPATLGISVNQAYILIERIFASGLQTGSISALNFANKLVQFPVSLVVLALGTAVFPTLSKLAAEGSFEELSAALNRLVKIMILAMVPAGIGLMVLRYPVVSLLFQHGAFGRQATELTAAALLFYSVGLVGQAAIIILSRGFYSVQDTRTPVKISLFTVLVNLCLSLVLIRVLQHAGLALASSLASLTGTVLLMICLEKKVAALKWSGLGKFILSVLAASGVMAAASYGVDAVLAGHFARSGTLGLAVRVGSAIATGVVAFIAAAIALRIEEIHLLLNYCRDAFGGLRNKLAKLHEH